VLILESAGKQAYEERQESACCGEAVRAAGEGVRVAGKRRVHQRQLGECCGEAARAEGKADSADAPRVVHSEEASVSRSQRDCEEEPACSP